MTDALVTWLGAQLDEDERVGRAVEGVRQPWYFEMIDDAARPLVELALDPARVLAEVDAKRRILDAHYEGTGDGTRCSVCCEGIWDCDPVTLPCATVKLLALPYADRPGYRQEWSPDT